MKKKILGLIIAVCLIVPCLFVVVGCGGPKPFNVKGKTFVGTKEVSIVWEEGVTEEQKQNYLTEEDYATEEDFLTFCSNAFGSYGEKIKFVYNEDGTVNIYFAGEDAELKGYYLQSEDLKTIGHYRTAEHVEGDTYSDGVGGMEYAGEGRYGIAFWEEEGLFTVYILFAEQK